MLSDNIKNRILQEITDDPAFGKTINFARFVRAWLKEVGEDYGYHMWQVQDTRKFGIDKHKKSGHPDYIITKGNVILYVEVKGKDSWSIEQQNWMIKHPTIPYVLCRIVKR